MPVSLPKNTNRHYTNLKFCLSTHRKIRFERWLFQREEDWHVSQLCHLMFRELRLAHVLLLCPPFQQSPQEASDRSAQIDG